MPAEQLANLYQTTIASNYTAGDGFIIVTSATGAPTTGPFTLTVLNAAGTTILLLFRVASVAGTTFTGAAEGPDSNAASTSIVVGTTLSVDAITNLFANSAALSHAQMGIMVALGNPTGFTWSWFNQASSVVTTSVTSDAINLFVPNSGGNNLSGRTTPVSGAAPYTLTIGLLLNMSAQTFNQFGIVITDGSNYIVIRIHNNSQTYDVYQWTGTGTPNTSLASGSIDPNSGLVFFLRIQEALGGTRFYQLSRDGLNWITLFSEPNGTYIVPTAGGFFGLCDGPAGGAATIMHATLTAP